MNRVFAILVSVFAFVAGCGGWELKDHVYHVFPSDDLQEAVNAAATNLVTKIVLIHEGVYGPRRPGPALVYLNRAHDGVRLKGLGNVLLTATNANIAAPSSPSYPAVVNHILYLGDGLTSNTVIEHFRLSGANHFVSRASWEQVEPDRELARGRFYFCDGGAIKIYHRSWPTLRELEIADNYASPCAGGISIQQEGATEQSVLIENCIFTNNHAEVTGSALDLLWGSSARVVNCLFVGNASNTGPGEGYNPFTNNGVVTVFQGSKVVLENCTFTRNRNGVDDMSGLSEYTRSIFYEDLLESGPPGQTRFELNLQRGGVVRDCAIQGRVLDPSSAVHFKENIINDVALSLGPGLVPKDSKFAGLGYHPAVNR